MIKIIVGNIGTGKTVSMVREIKRRQDIFRRAGELGLTDKPYLALTNFNLKEGLLYKRIKLSDIVKKVPYASTTPSGKEKITFKDEVNWEFWDELRKNYYFDIFLDELNSTVNARDAASKLNKVVSKWLFQIRKILGTGEFTHIYIVTQDLDQIDINFRRMAHFVIGCDKHLIDSEVLIMNTIYPSVLHFNASSPLTNKIFKASNYFKYYDSYDLVKFGDEGEYL